MATAPTNSELPDGSTCYVFGSVLHRGNPRDLDVLIVYDASLCLPERAYEAHNAFVASLASSLRRRVDVTLLTRGEEEGIGFVRSEGCVPLERAMPTLAAKCQYTNG